MSYSSALDDEVCKCREFIICLNLSNYRKLFLKGYFKLSTTSFKGNFRVFTLVSLRFPWSRLLEEWKITQYSQLINNFKNSSSDLLTSLSSLFNSKLLPAKLVVLSENICAHLLLNLKKCVIVAINTGLEKSVTSSTWQAVFNKTNQNVHIHFVKANSNTNQRKIQDEAFLKKLTRNLLTGTRFALKHRTYTCTIF